MELIINLLILISFLFFQQPQNTLDRIIEQSTSLEVEYFKSFSIPIQKSHYILEAIYWRNSKDSLQVSPDDIKDGLENGYTLESIKKLLKERHLFYYYDLDTARKYVLEYKIDNLIVALKNNLFIINNVKSISVCVNNYMFIKLTPISNNLENSFFAESDFLSYSTELINPRTHDAISYSEVEKVWTYIREIRNFKNEKIYLYVEFTD